ncbi:MAG: hypothetical protein ACREPU_05745 [Rhodanobacteraceae bacterium]
MNDKKDQWIAELVAGKSFMDVGGLWGTKNEKVSVAVNAGAARTTMADIAPLGHALWNDFDARCARLGIHGYAKRHLDIVELAQEVAEVHHQIVHCSGIIYHVPDPYRMLANLRRVTDEHLILTSMVVPESIENAAGHLTFPRDRAVFVPSMTEATRAIVATHFRGHDVSIDAITRPMTENWRWPDGVPNYGPWWWLMSPDYLCGLLEVAGFGIEDTCWSWEGLSYSVLARRCD